MSTQQYTWHARRVFFVDRVNQQRYQAEGHELLWGSPHQRASGQRIYQPTGLGYYSQYRRQELPPLYRHNETGLGAHGSYYPLHIPSGEQLVHSVWGGEETIQWFLQQLVEQALEPDYWQKEEYSTILGRFPGGRNALTLLEHFSVCKEIARRREGEEWQFVHQMKALCTIATEDQRLDEGIRSIFDDLARHIETGSTAEDCVRNLEKWTTNLERTFPSLLPPYCAAMAQKATIYRQLLTVLREEESAINNVPPAQ